MPSSTSLVASINRIGEGEQEGAGEMILIIKPRFAHLVEEMKSIFKDQQRVRIVLDRRSGERRMQTESVAVDRRRGERRSQCVNVVDVVIKG